MQIDTTVALSQFVGSLPTFIAVILAWIQSNARIGDLKTSLDKRIDDTNGRLNNRLDSSDNRFEDMNRQMDRRFDDVNRQMDRRFDDVNRHIDDKFALLSQQMKSMEDNIMRILGDHETRIQKFEGRRDTP